MTTISNNRRKKFKAAALLLLIPIGIFVGAAFLWRDALANMLWRAASPLISIKQGSVNSAGSFFSQFASNASLAEENARLRASLASTSILLMDRDLLLRENIDLKNRLGRGQEPLPILAAVLLAPPGMPYDTLMIDAGKDHGIREGDLVAAGGSVYIGRIANVYDTASRVILFSSPGQTYQALLRGSIPVSLSGQGGGSIVGELPVGTEVAAGDSVTLPSIMPQFIAQITSVVRREGESFQSIYLSLAVNPYGLRVVEVHAAASPQ